MHPNPLKSGYVSMEELWKWSSVDNDSSGLGIKDEALILFKKNRNKKGYVRWLGGSKKPLKESKNKLANFLSELFDLELY